ncbi:CheR family methyltransferase, partial [Puia sp.]|uniref:CheR family methyltransferase n=1 Tax=Puia sp. TaxID=2045100 RepID=UPI002F41D253
MPNINENHKDKLFPIVAIGASAGGLEAISSLLEHLPPKLGMAYVIIQHLSPVYPSILPELLERKTTMPVLQVTDGLAVERDKVYVIPPNSYMSIVDHKLILSPRVQTDGFYHSIDHFLMALAPVYKHNAIAVILSGTATDGTDGIRVIKAEGGITFAQDESAKFRGMPDSAANSGNVDFIMAPDQMAAELETLSRLPYTALASLDDVSLREQELRKIQVLLFKKWRVDFSNYKQSTITRRILRRMALNKIKQLEDYTRFLREDQTEINLLYKDLLINVTSFFREPLLFEEFSRSIFPTLFGNKKPADIIRIWVPACSSGEEVYSIAICLFEWLAQQSVVSPIQLFATDLSEGAIEKARMGIYSIASVEKISPERLEQFFIKIDGHYQIIKPIRDVCIFATHDLLKDPPFSKLDLISCQNVLIYLESESQKRILQSFHYALKPSGYLLLGRSETIGGSGELFNSASKEFKLFTKKTHSNFPFDFSVRNNVNAPFNATDEEKMVTSQPAEPDIDKEAEKVLLSRYVPASVTVDQDLHIKQFYGSTINYLHPAAGKASFHLLKMVREELIFEVRLLLNKAMKDAIPAKKDGILLSDDKYKREISIEVVPLRTSSNRSHYLIVFKETGSEPSEAPSQEPGQLETNREDDSRVVHIKTL